MVLEQLPAWLRFCNVFAKKSCQNWSTYNDMLPTNPLFQTYCHVRLIYSKIAERFFKDILISFQIKKKLKNHWVFSDFVIDLSLTLRNYLSSFWRSLEMPLINWKVELNRTNHCALSENGSDNNDTDPNFVGVKRLLVLVESSIRSYSDMLLTWLDLELQQLSYLGWIT